MTFTKKRSGILALVLVLVAVAAIVALSLSLRAQAADLVIFNVYVGDATQAEAYAKANAEETGYKDDPGFAAPYHQAFDTPNEAYAAITASAVTSEMAKYNKGEVRVNMWILKDTENTTTNNGIFGSQNTLYVKFQDSARAEDVMLNVTGVTGFGEVAGDHPLVRSNTTNNYGYFYTATTLKNVTIQLTKSHADKNFIFLQGHEFVADEGVQINNYDGTPITRLIGSGYTGWLARESHQCYNGFGPYNTYVEESFAGKITLRSGNWAGVEAANGHPGVDKKLIGDKKKGDSVYDFSTTQRGDYYITIEGTAAVSTLSAGKNNGTSFVGGENCTVNYLVRGNAMVTSLTCGAYAGANINQANPGKDGNNDSYGDNTRQYFDINVTVEGDPIIGSMVMYNSVGSKDYAAFFFGDITVNLKGGTFDRTNPDLVARGYGSATGETNVRAAQGNTSQNAAATVYLGTITWNIGDPETGKGPKLGPTYNSAKPLNGNHLQGLFYVTLGLGTGKGNFVYTKKVDGVDTTVGTFTYTGSYVDEPMYKVGNDYIIPAANNPTMGEWAADHAGFVLNMYGGEMGSFVAPVVAKISKGVDINIYGGTLGALTFNRAHDAGDASTVASLRVKVEGGTIESYTGPGYAIDTEYSLTVGKAGQSNLAEGETGGVIKQLKKMVGCTTVQGDMSFTVQGMGKVETLTSLLDATDGNSSVNGSLNILLKENAEITQFNSFLMEMGTNGKNSAIVGGSVSSLSGSNEEILAKSKGDLNFTMKDNALIQRTVTDADKKGTASTPCGIYLFGARNNTNGTNWPTYVVGNFNFNMEGGTIRCLNDSKNEVAIFLGGLNFIPYGNVSQTFKGDATVEIAKTGNATGSVSGIYAACNFTTWFGHYEILMEDCTFKSYAAKPLCFSGKTVTGAYGTRNVTVGTPDGEKFPKLEGISSIYLNGNWAAVGNGSQNLPEEGNEKKEVVSRITVYNIETTGDLCITQANTAYGDTGKPKKIYSFIDGDLETKIYGGTAKVLYLAQAGATMGNVNATISGGTFDEIALGQCRKINTVTIDMDKVNVGKISYSHRNVVDDGTGQIDTSIKGDLDLTLNNFEFDDKVLALGKTFHGNLGFHWVGGSCSIANPKILDGVTVNGDLNYELKNVSIPGTFGVTTGTCKINGDLTTTFSGVEITVTAGNLYAIGTGNVTVTGDVETTVKDGTTLAGKYYGGSQNGSSGSITNNIEDLTITGIYYGGNGASANKTVTTGSITNNLTGLKSKTTVYGGSEHGNITGNITNNVSGTTVTGGNFYGGCAHANINGAGKVGGTVINNIEGVTLNGFNGGSYGGYSIGKDSKDNNVYDSTGAVIEKGIVNNLTNVDVNFRGASETRCTFGSVYGTVKANDDGYAIKSTVDGLRVNAGIVAGMHVGTVEGNVSLDIANVDQHNARHFMVGNLQTSVPHTVDGSEYDLCILNGNVEVTLRSGSVGPVYLGARPNTSADNIASDVVTGSVTFNIKGGMVGNINKGYSATKPVNCGGDCIVNIDTTENDVIMRGTLSNVYTNCDPIDEINIIAGDYTLYKYNNSATYGVSDEAKIAANDYAWVVDSLTGTLKLATAEGLDWNAEVVHLTVKGADKVADVVVTPGPTSTLVGEYKDGDSIWTALDYSFDVEDISRTIKLGNSYSVRYLFDKEQLDFFGLENVIVSYQVTTNGVAADAVTATLVDGATDGYEGYYFFLVEGIFAKDYDRVDITVTVTIGGEDTVLENDSVAKALKDLAVAKPDYAELAQAITDYAKSLEAYFYGDVDAPQVTMPAERREWIKGVIGGKTATEAVLAEGVTAMAINLTTTDTLTINFWVKAEDASKITKAAVINADGESVDVLDTLTPRGDGVYSLSYECGAGDLATMLTLTLGGETGFKACPLSYADALSRMAGYQDLGSAIIEYAYYVSTLLG